MKKPKDPSSDGRNSGYDLPGLLALLHLGKDEPIAKNWGYWIEIDLLVLVLYHAIGPGI